MCVISSFEIVCVCQSLFHQQQCHTPRYTQTACAFSNAAGDFFSYLPFLGEKIQRERGGGIDNTVTHSLGFNKLFYSRKWFLSRISKSKRLDRTMMMLLLLLLVFQVEHDLKFFYLFSFGLNICVVVEIDAGLCKLTSSKQQVA